MKVKYLLFVLIVCLVGCKDLIRDTHDYPDDLEPRLQQIQAWAASEWMKVEAGTLKDSEYWKSFYMKSIELRPDLDSYLYFAKEMIKISRIFEEGTITREQFEDRCHELSALLNEEQRRRAAALPRLDIPENYEAALFTVYRGSLFLDYMYNLQKNLSELGPQFSSDQCVLFEDGIKCTSKRPPF